MSAKPRNRKASAAQARRLAHLFWRGTPTSYSENISSATDRAMVANGWLTCTGEDHEWPSGAMGKLYKLNDAGLFALELYLSHVRVSKASAPPKTSAMDVSSPDWASVPNADAHFGAEDS